MMNHTRKKWTLAATVAVALTGIAVLPAGCSNSDAPKEQEDAQSGTPKANRPAADAGVVNTACPMMGSKINPKKVPANLTREWKGEKVGFCCAGCPEAWDKLSDAEKEKKLAAVKPADNQ